MIKDGIMIFDNYNFLTYPSRGKAADEFLGKSENLCYLPTR